MKIATAFLIFTCLGCGIQKPNISWDNYAANHAQELRGIGAVEISRVPSDPVFSEYKNAASAKVQLGVYDALAHKIWAVDYASALHEVGHFLWSEKLSANDRKQWIEWFANTKAFPSLRSRAGHMEFFAEHYRLFSLGKVTLPASGRSHEVTVEYGPTFPNQDGWFKKKFPAT
jgi:hypothetical protein